MDRVGGSTGSYGDRCAGCGRECLHRVVAVHLVDDSDGHDPVASRVLPSCGPDCDAASAARATRPRRGARVVIVPWRLDGVDWRPDGEAPAAPADPLERALLAAGGRWFAPVRCGHRPAHVARVVSGAAQAATWTRWSCPDEAASATPAADPRLSDVVEHPVAAWNPALLRYDGAGVRRVLHR